MFVVIELQTNDTTANIVNAYSDRNVAEQRYHQILAAAATSDVKLHSAVMLTSEGFFIKSEHYEHPTEEF